MSANDKQVGGTHYDKEGEQHWDRIYRLYGRGYFVGCATKYIERYHLKNGKQDLEKAIHFIEKLIELEYPNENEGHEPKKYPDDYQEQLSLKMEKMREDAMTGVPDHMRDVAKQESALSPMLRNYLGIRDEDDASKPMSHGYVNQDLPYINKGDENV